MKKVLALILSVCLISSLAACNKAPNQDQPSVTETMAEESSQTAAEESSQPAEEQAEDSLGQTLLTDFDVMMSEGEDLSPLDIANRLMENKKIEFEPGNFEVEPGLLAGFGNFEVKGFDQGATFGPMISAIPFIGYIFRLPESADIEAFKAELKDNANLAWNVCVEADQLICESRGQMVFFVMCPKEF